MLDEPVMLCWYGNGWCTAPRLDEPVVSCCTLLCVPIVEAPHMSSQCWVSHPRQAAPKRSGCFDGAEREQGNICAAIAVVSGPVVALGDIFYHENIVLSPDCHNIIHVETSTKNVGDDNHRCFLPRQRALGEQ